MIERDKLLHLAFNGCAAAGIAVLCWIASQFGIWIATGIGGTAVAVSYELVQQFRGDGEPSVKDAAYGAAASWMIAAAVWLY